MADAHDPYVAAGVDYSLLDAGKRLALAAALPTSPAMGLLGAEAMDATRGESAFAFRLGPYTLAIVMEGLGTKSMIARAYRDASGVNRFGDVAYDAVAAILNDLCCVGAIPLVLNAYFATGSSDWYRDGEQVRALINGWRRACDDAQCTWGGGESPSLPGLVNEGEIELAGSAVGLVPPGRPTLSGDTVKPGCELVLVASSGLHANGASLARKVATEVPDGYLTPLPSGQTFGEALLEPSVLYAKLTRELLQREAPIVYLSHITGHGVLKVMRPPSEQTYRLHSLPEVPEVLSYLAYESGLDSQSAYRTLNMGVGLVIYCEPGAGDEVAAGANDLGYHAMNAGVVESGPRRVVVEPIGATYGTSELNLSAKTDAPAP